MTRIAFSLLALGALLNVSCVDGPKPPDDGPDDSGPPDDTAPCVEEDGDGYCVSDGDCDDNNPAVNPAVDEICDGVDNNCDGEIDEGGETVFYADADGDGFGDAQESMQACEPEAGWVTNDGDCDDADVTAYPDAPELCDGIDNDCDGVIDNDLATIFYRDADGDGYGDEGNYTEQCLDPGEGWIAVGGDCDDTEPLAWTGAAEVCDGVDNDCNGTIDDGLSTTWYRDSDGDGYGNDLSATDSCTPPGREWIASGGDCDDSEPLAWTGADEYCDDVDNDCNGTIDDNALDATYQTADADGDGYGSPTATVLSCDAIVDNADDCDDTSALEPVHVSVTGSATGTGTATNPYDTVQAGIDAANVCVFVLAGRYYENIDFDGKDILVSGVDGWAATILDGSGAGSVVSFQTGEGLGAELRGFTIENGGGTLESSSTTESCGSATTCTTTYDRYYGGGIIVDGATPTLAELWVNGNSLPAYSYAETGTDFEYVYSYGGGMFVNNSTGMVVEDVVFESNFADAGGGVYAADAASFDMTRTRLLYNTAAQGGGYVASGGTVDLTNAILAGNDATTAGGGAWIDGGSSTWWNVSAVANDAPSGGGVGVYSGGSFYLYSSSITAAATGEGVYVESGSSATNEYANVYGNAGGNAYGDISSDPMFTSWTDDDTDNDDLSLATGSALIDAGNPSAAYNDADATTNDIGAYGGPGSRW